MACLNIWERCDVDQWICLVIQRLPRAEEWPFPRVGDLRRICWCFAKHKSTCLRLGLVEQAGENKVTKSEANSCHNQGSHDVIRDVEVARACSNRVLWSDAADAKVHY